MDKPLLKEMISYSGWSLFGNSSNIAWNAGTNILMNIFFGPIVNAANAIAQQVSAAISSFYTNFTMALNPQIIKTYAAGEMQQMKALIFRGGKFSFFLLMIFLIPVFLETDTLLLLWLRNVPEYASIFTKLIMICTSLVGCFGITVSMAVQATGKVKYYQITIGCILLLAFPLTYVCYKLGATPATAYIGMMATAIIAIFARMFFLKKYLNISYVSYLKNILWISFVTFIFSAIPPYFVHEIMSNGVLRLLVVSCVTLISTSIFVYVFGLTQAERQSVNRFIIKKMNNI
jgi:O-antigen/teichoic acid export membrane protein